jgi:F-type H+-transporting ATPase subunit epsilon
VAEPAHLELEVATPERLLVRERVLSVEVPAITGAIGVLPEHAPLLSLLGTGPLTFQTVAGRRKVFISGGWVQILNNHVRVLADRAEHANEIDVARAEASLKRAQERLQLPASAQIDVARAINAMRRAEARIAAARAGHLP